MTGAIEIRVSYQENVEMQKLAGFKVENSLKEFIRFQVRKNKNRVFKWVIESRQRKMNRLRAGSIAEPSHCPFMGFVELFGRYCTS